MPRYLKARLRAIAALMLTVEWGVAWAAMDTVWPQLTEWPWLQVLVGCLVSWCGGVTSYLIRFTAASYEERHFHTLHEFAGATVYSLVAGMGACFMAAAFPAAMGNEGLVGLILLGAGFSAVQFLTELGRRVVAMVRGIKND